MEDFLVTSLVILLILTGVGIFICCAMALGLGDCTKKLWGLFISARPKSGIDKEIAEEEKEIAELERQKEKIDTLANLKRRKERLFHDVRDTPKREELNSDIAVSFSGNKNRLDVEFISGWHKVYYSHAYNLDEIKQAIYDKKPIIEEDVRL